MFGSTLVGIILFGLILVGIILFGIILLELISVGMESSGTVSGFDSSTTGSTFQYTLKKGMHGLVCTRGRQAVAGLRGRPSSLVVPGPYSSDIS